MMMTTTTTTTKPNKEIQKFSRSLVFGGNDDLFCGRASSRDRASKKKINRIKPGKENEKKNSVKISADPVSTDNVKEYNNNQTRKSAGDDTRGTGLLERWQLSNPFAVALILVVGVRCLFFFFAWRFLVRDTELNN